MFTYILDILSKRYPKINRVGVGWVIMADIVLIVLFFSLFPRGVNN
jgi:hypothetical protein